ncbi:hypothetical protein B0H19DRAFT_1071970 [Mycena capillaripes]|nr:hypothetical protein B0H19DRAFT_1071970 [Mycena capillaripes]
MSTKKNYPAHHDENVVEGGAHSTRSERTGDGAPSDGKVPTVHHARRMPSEAKTLRRSERVREGTGYGEEGVHDASTPNAEWCEKNGGADAQQRGRREQRLRLPHARNARGGFGGRRVEAVHGVAAGLGDVTVPVKHSQQYIANILFTAHSKPADKATIGHCGKTQRMALVAGWRKGGRGKQAYRGDMEERKTQCHIPWGFFLPGEVPKRAGGALIEEYDTQVPLKRDCERRRGVKDCSCTKKSRKADMLKITNSLWGRLHSRREIPRQGKHREVMWEVESMNIIHGVGGERVVERGLVSKLDNRSIGLVKVTKGLYDTSASYKHLIIPIRLFLRKEIRKSR